MSGAKRARVLATTSLGLVALTLLYLLVIPRLAERIPVALEQAAENRLDAEGMAWAGASADGRDLRLEGEAPSPEALHARIAFASGDVRIGVDSDPLLRDLAAALKSCPKARVFIAGHTDDQGAEAVAERLISEGVERQRIETSGYGSERPVADNNTEAGRAKNRRIEFVVEAGL